MESDTNLRGDNDRSLLKIIGITVVLIAVLLVLYWIGRQLLFKPEEFPLQRDGLPLYLVPGCSRRVYTNVDAALQTTEMICMLRLADQNLVSLPSTIGKLTELRTLDIPRNQLTQLPEEIGALTNLIGISLSNNNFDRFPPQLLTLKQLEGVIIRNSRITELPESISELTELRILTIAHNRLTSLPVSQLARLSHLQRLDVRGNAIPPDQILQLKRALPSTTILY